MRVIAVLLILGSMLVAFVGAATLSQATQGVGTIALACFIAIIGRIAQASAETDDVRAALKKMIENQQAFIRAQTGRGDKAALP